MSAHVVFLRAPRSRRLRSLLRRLAQVRAAAAWLAAERRRRLVEREAQAFDERGFFRRASDPRDDPRFHRWRWL